MNRLPRPFAVTVLGCLFLGVGSVGFIYHLHEFLVSRSFQSDMIWIELTEFLAIVGGAFLLRGRNWARWLILGWVAFHVILTALNAFHQFAVHALLFVGIGWLLFRPESSRYFRNSPREPG
jgi:hypothetical protein